VRFAGSLQEVTRHVRRGQRVRVRLLDAQGAARAAAVLAALPGVSAVDESPLEVTLRFDGVREEVPGLHRALVEAGVPGFAFEVGAQDLESLFLEVTQGLVT